MSFLLEERQDVLRLRVGNRQRLDGQRLLGLQRGQLGAGGRHVSVGQGADAVGQVVGDGRAVGAHVLDDVAVGAERRGDEGHGLDGCLHLSDHVRDIAGALEGAGAFEHVGRRVDASGAAGGKAKSVGQARASGASLEGGAGAEDRRCACDGRAAHIGSDGGVEAGDGGLVALQAGDIFQVAGGDAQTIAGGTRDQVDAIEGGIARDGVDLLKQAGDLRADLVEGGGAALVVAERGHSVLDAVEHADDLVDGSAGRADRLCGKGEAVIDCGLAGNIALHLLGNAVGSGVVSGA